MSGAIEDEIGGFLARWSRRKAAARRGTPEPEEPAPPARAEATGEGGPEPGGEPVPPEPVAERAGAPEPSPDRETIDLANLPDPDTLDATSDFSLFMRPGAPAELRRRALRRLWKVNPIVSTPDGLDDYYVVNDFSDASTVVADLKTLYRVGRGMLAALDETPQEAGSPGPPAERPADEAAAPPVWLESAADRSASGGFSPAEPEPSGASTAISQAEEAKPLAEEPERL